MALPAFYLLPRVISLGLCLLHCFHTLAVENPCGGLFLVPLFLAHLAPKLIAELPPRPVPLALREEVVDELPVRIAPGGVRAIVEYLELPTTNARSTGASGCRDAGR
jgi:hypothetical protein